MAYQEPTDGAGKIFLGAFLLMALIGVYGVNNACSEWSDRVEFRYQQEEAIREQKAQMKRLEAKEKADAEAERWARCVKWDLAHQEEMHRGIRLEGCRSDQ